MSHVRATRIAAEVGKGFALVFGIIGLFYDPWLVLVALFVWLGPDTNAGGAFFSWLFITFASLWILMPMVLSSFKGVGQAPIAIYLIVDVAGFLALGAFICVGMLAVGVSGPVSIVISLVSAFNLFRLYGSGK